MVHTLLLFNAHALNNVGGCVHRSYDNGQFMDQCRGEPYPDDFTGPAIFLGEPDESNGRIGSK
jgi:hypothetical protein